MLLPLLVLLAIEYAYPSAPFGNNENPVDKLRCAHASLTVKINADRDRRYAV